ncbi:MAG: tRNA (adenosine(37)-N6)-threonylcarbamoyltransferase complex transferase subunit TsaD [Rickettsiales bacterium]|nr:tRNA (adenosine(37)-N6)-threonylcarbamoyltransferase complex transferase subunit TsaD [Rickettsiales bacterium]
MKILAIESSCDETAAAIITDTKEVLAHKIVTQLEEHQPYGGVVPEIASRSHITYADKLVKEVMQEAGVDYSDLDAVAATKGPGLIGGLIVGVMTAKAIAHAAKLPFIGVNHLEGHALTVRLTDEVEFPFLLLLLSGGHCQILSVDGVGKYHCLGKTLDDALGEAYDKVAKMLGLGYPGGPIVEQYALDGDPKRFKLPVPLKNRPWCDFSFSGLKTAVRREIELFDAPLSKQDIADICASFQYTVGLILSSRVTRAIAMYKEIHPDSNHFVLSGGVAANSYIREILDTVLEEHDMKLFVPPVRLCTDNAAMIGWAAIENMKLGKVHQLDVSPKARWPLDSL